mmetsp:Transcript_66579/g.124242  ORF Transcript_66579/g.124242 Transcript_66579/m.124242 type:complete len:225 (+) Transcript_66579:51-725(+)
MDIYGFHDCCPCCCCSCCSEGSPGPGAYSIVRLMDAGPYVHRSDVGSAHGAKSSPAWGFGSAKRGARAWNLDTPGLTDYNPMLFSSRASDRVRGGSRSASTGRKSFQTSRFNGLDGYSWTVCSKCQGARRRFSDPTAGWAFAHATPSGRPRSKSVSAPGPGAYLGPQEWVRTEASGDRLEHSLEGIEYGGRRRRPPAAVFGTASRGLSRPRKSRCWCGRSQWKM